MPQNRGQTPSGNSAQSLLWGLTPFLFGVALAVTGWCAAPSADAAPATINHSAWEDLLWQFVEAGAVDYEGLQTERQTLDAYVASLAEVDLKRLASTKEQLAFWINAYNACVVQAVLDHYPVKSVKDIPGFFDKQRHRVAGKSLTLNQVEEQGRLLKDWRIHMAVVCAASSCPPLRSEAYVADRLDEQLADQARQFLAGPSRGFRVDRDGGILWLSKIVKWYATDFVSTGPLTAQTILPVIAPSLDPSVAQAVREQRFTLKFLDYDWTLNRRPSVSQPPASSQAASP